MNKKIQDLVDEALTNITNTYHTSWKQILTTLAEKASKNGLQPLPEAMPEWFITYFNNRGNVPIICVWWGVTPPQFN